ncbi:hypothetical protein J4210_00095 [Candidatus Woesearchaeota archaeon]|nr:hypothetical protein [Candidatus Woesearchaeota archaeon]
MIVTKAQRQILFALGEFYKQLNQPLEAKPVQLRTSKVVFITFLLHSGIVAKQERALYKNLEMLEQKRLITYENRMIRFTNAGIFILKKIDKEIEEFLKIKQFFSEKLSLKKEFQTVMELRKR